MTHAAIHATGPYIVPHVKIDCDAFYTNHPPAGSSRGFGATQVHFAIETQMDILAEQLDLSPFIFRQQNALRTGGLTATGQRLTESAGLPATIERVRRQVRELAGTDATAPYKPLDANKRRGWGVACAFKGVGLGSGADDVGRAVVELTDTGSVRVHAGAAEIGQGLATVLAQIVAEVLGTDPARIEVVLGHTNQTPDSGPTTASRQTYVTGNAARLAADKLRRELMIVTASKLNAAPDSLILQDSRVLNSQGNSISFSDAAALAARQGRSLKASFEYHAPPTVPLGQAGNIHFAYGFGTQAAQVEVNLDNGEVKVLRVVAAHDVGRAVNPMAVEGQIEGGIVMGLGYALTEEFKLCRAFVRSDDLVQYKIPTIHHMPEIHPIILEYQTREGPFGAKGIGEITSIPTAPAILNAIYNACGVRLTRLPATPQRILAALKTNKVK